MVEHMMHALDMRRQASADGSTRADSVLDTIREAALEIERPIFFSLVIIVSAYIPLFTLERVERRLFTPMAFTVCYALFGSMLLALTLIPVLATYLFRNAPTSWENPIVTWLHHRYGRLLESTVDHPWRVVAGAGGIVAAACVVGALLGSEFLPQLDEGVLWIRANFPAGISLEKSADLATQIRALVKRSPEVKEVTSQTGRNDDGTDPYGPNRNEFFVALTPYETWEHGKRKPDLVDELSRRLRTQIPGGFFSFTQPIIDNVTEAVTGSPADLAVIITGPDLRELRRLGRETLDILKTVPGAADTGIEQEDDQAQLRIRIDRQAVARFGLNVRDVQDVIELAIGGRSASTYFDGERRFDITVRYIPEARTDVAAIGSILVATKSGERVPLAELATIEVVNGASIIARRENRRMISVRTNIRGRDQGGFVADAQRQFASHIVLPAGYSVDWGGQFENLARARRRLAFILPLTIAVIFGLLFFAFGTVGEAGLVLLNVPFSLVGGIGALYLRGINLSVSAAVGFISLFGVAVMSGVLVVSDIKRRRLENVPPRDAVIQGALAQMRPVLMMVIVALLGMVPAARATGVGSDVQRPLATVVVGGLCSTLLLTLFALPALSLILAGGPKERI
jgi:cobalt-zinc-cadmium resistance protein CzcA